MIKDWVHEASIEIADAAGLDQGAVEDFEAIIERHAPFERDVVYMPVPRCETCKHWEHRGIRDYCGNQKLKLWASLLFVPPLETSKDFGCVQWEAK